MVGLLRPRDWWYFLPAPALGARLLGLPWDPLFGVLSAGLCLAFAYGANGIADRMHDAVDKNPFAGHETLPWTVRGVVLVAAAPVPVLAALGLTSFWPLASLLAATLYSVPPLRFKRFPLIGDAMNMAIFFPLLLFAPGAWPGAGDPTWIVWIALQIQVSQMIHCLEDLDEDRARGLRNTVILLGETGSRRVLLGLAQGALVLGLWGGHGASRVVLGGGALAALGVVLAAQRAGASMRGLRGAHRVVVLLTLTALFLTSP